MPRLRQYEIEALSIKIISEINKKHEEIRQSEEYKNKFLAKLAEEMEHHSEIIEKIKRYESLIDEANHLKSEIKEYELIDKYDYNPTSEKYLDRIEKECISDINEEFNLDRSFNYNVKQEVILSAVEGLDDIVDRVVDKFIN